MTMTKAEEAVLSVHAALEMGVGVDVAVTAALKPATDKAQDKALAAARLTLDPGRHAGVIGGVLMKQLTGVAGDYLGLAVALLAELANVTGRPADELIAAAAERGSS